MDIKEKFIEDAERFSNNKTAPDEAMAGFIAGYVAALKATNHTEEAESLLIWFLQMRNYLTEQEESNE